MSSRNRKALFRIARILRVSVSVGALMGVLCALFIPMFRNDPQILFPLLAVVIFSGVLYLSIGSSE